MESHLRRARPALFAGMLLAATGVARGDAADVFNVSLGHVASHDSNLFRLAPETDAEAAIGSSKRADSYSRSTLRLTADKPLGRQTLHAAAGLSRVRYDRFQRLDSDLSDYNGRWDWALGHLWSGQLKVGRGETAPGFSDYRAPVADRVTTDTGEARAVLMFHPAWRLTLGATQTEAKHSAAVNAIGDSRVQGAEAGLRYVPGTGKEAGVRLRRSDGRYPNRQAVGGVAVDNGYAEEGMDLDAAWQASGASRFRGSIGQSRRRHDDVPGRDFSGATGSLAWDWQVTGKTSLGLAARREIGAQEDLIATYAVTESLSLRAAWAPTSKLSLNASAEARQRDLRGDPAAALAGLPARRDDYRIASVSAGYAPLRDLQLSLALRRERRDSNMPGFSYRTDQVTASVQFVF
jgi:exopolysaccharide biosynthesis operon protein EpsL